jgi:hypothetical protein
VPVKIKEKNIKSNVIIKNETEKLFSFKMHLYPDAENKIKQLRQETKGRLTQGEFDRVKAKYDNTLKFINDTPS